MLCIEVPRRRQSKRHATKTFEYALERSSTSVTGAPINFDDDLGHGECYISEALKSPSPSSSALIRSIDTREAALVEREQNLRHLEKQVLSQQEVLRNSELVLAGRQAELEDRARLLDQTSMISAGQALLDQIEAYYTCPLSVYFPSLNQCHDMLITSSGNPDAWTSCMRIHTLILTVFFVSLSH